MKHPFIATVWAIVLKDIQIERHTRQSLSIMLMFSMVTVVLFNFALADDLAAARSVATGLLWTTIVLAGTLGLNRSLAIERENQTMSAMLVAPIDRHAIYVGKVLSVTLFTVLLEVMLVFIFTIFFNKPFWQPAIVALLLLGTVGYVAVGVLITSLTVQTRARDVLLPVLLLPLTLPLVLPAATAVAFLLLPDTTWADLQGPVYLVIVYDILMVTVGLATFRYVVE